MSAECVKSDNEMTTVAAQGVVACSESSEMGATEFWQRVNALIALLNSRSAPRCALVCHSASGLAASLIALSHCGRTTVVPPAPTESSLRACEADVDVVITDRPDQFSHYETLAIPAVSGSDCDTPQSVNDAALIEFYTSGSSDRPECIRQDFGMLRRELEELEREWGDRLGDAMVVGTVPHYHRYGLLVAVIWPLMKGRTFYETSCPSPSALRAAVGAHDCVIISSPAFLKRTRGGTELPPFHQVNAIFSSGAPLPDETAERLAHDWGQAPIEIYGSTETGGIAWRCWSDDTSRARWQPLKRAEIELRPEAAGDRLWVRTPYTVEWMPSGDLARHDDDGSFVLLGRADGVVKVEDRRVSLNEMRSRLMEHPWVVNAGLIVMTGHRTQIGAAVMLSVAGRAALEDSGKKEVCGVLQTALRETYAPAVVPRKWRFVEDWPENDMGKVTQQFLRGLFETPE